MMAKLEDLKKAWQSQSGISQARFDQIGSKVKDGSELLQSTIFRRDVRETAAAAVVAGICSLLLFISKNWIDFCGYAIVVIAGISIPIVLWWARKRSLVTVSAGNFRDFLDIEIDYQRRQVQLLRMVTWWYLLPTYVGVVLIMTGVSSPHDSFSDLFMLALMLSLCGGFYVYVWCLNQSARKKQLEPLLDYYVEMREAIDSGEDSVLQLPDPPLAFLQSGAARKPISGRARRIWIVLIVAAALAVVAAGIGIMQFFDPRTGKFVTSTTPVVVILMVVVSGIWRPSSE